MFDYDHFDLSDVLSSMNFEENMLRVLKIFLEDGYVIKEEDIRDYYHFERSNDFLRFMLENYHGTLSKNTIKDVLLDCDNIPFPDLAAHACKNLKFDHDEIIDILFNFDEDNILNYKYFFEMVETDYMDEDEFREILNYIPEKAYRFAKRWFNRLDSEALMNIWEDYYEGLEEGEVMNFYYKGTNNNESYEVAINDIKEGLTGDPRVDMAYLKMQTDKYKDHKFSKEIIREIARMIYALLPEEKKREMNETISKNEEGFDVKIEKCKYLIYKKQIKEALPILEKMIEEVEITQPFEDDAVTEYYSFSEVMEELIFRTTFESRKEIRRCPTNLSGLYFLYGNALFDIGRMDEAKNALEKARRWNPVDTSIGFEYAEVFKKVGDIETFYEETMKVHPFIFLYRDLARFYRNLGYYYTEKEDYKVAVCCYMYSAQFEKSELVPAELYYIIRKSGTDYQPGIEEITEYFKKNDIPELVDENILKIAYTMGADAKENGNKDMIAYFWGIFAEFIDDEEVIKTLVELKSGR